MQWKRRMQITGIIIGVYLGFRYVLPVTIPFLLGWLLAVCCYPTAKKAEETLHVRPVITGSILMVLAVSGAAALLWLGIREGLEQLRYLLSDYQALEQQGVKLLEQCCQALEDGIGLQKEHSQAFMIRSMGRIQTDLEQKIGLETVEQATACLKWLIRIVSGLVIAVISGIFILRDMDPLRREAREYSMFQGCRRILRRLKETAALYFKAQLLIMLTISVECTMGFYLLGSPYYLLLGLALGLLDALPLIGTGLFLYPAAVFFLIMGRPMMGIGCALLGILASVTREFMEPRLIGKKLGVYPVVILGAVYLGMVLYGPIGVLFGPLSFFLMYEIGKEWDVWD